MATITVTLTQPFDSMAVAFIPVQYAAVSGSGGQGFGNQTYSVQFQDGSGNKVDIVGTAEMLHNLARAITQAIKP